MSDVDNPEQVNPFASPLAVDTEPAPLAVWASDDLSGLRYVRIGLLLSYLGACGIVILFLITGIMGALTARAAPGAVAGQPPAGLAMLMFAIGIMSILLMTLLVVGPWFCLGVPAGTGSKGYILATVGCQAMAVVLWIGVVTEVIPPHVITGIATNLFFWVAILLFLLFMRSLSQYLQRTDLVKRANRVLIFGALFFVAAIAVGFLLFESIAAGRPPVMFGIGILVLVVAGLVLFVMHANLINYLRKAIAV